MKKKGFEFYSEKEVRLIEKCLKEGMNASQCGKALSKKLGRSRMALMMKASSILKKNGTVTKKKVEKIKGKQTQLGLSDGTTVEFTPKKVLLEENRVIIYI